MKKRFLSVFMVLTMLITSSGLSSIVQAAETEAAPDLILWYDMDEIVDGKITDSSGNGLDGVVKGNITTANGMRGDAIALDGNGDYVEIPSLGAALKEVDDFTISTFVNLGANRNYQRVFDFGVGQTGSFMCVTPNNINTWCRGISYSISNNGGGEANEKGTSYDTSLGVNQWRHLTVTQEGDTARMYIDGELVSESACLLSPCDLEEATVCYLGRSLWNDPYFLGKMDDFRIYNRALGADEIKEIAVLSDEEIVNAAYGELNIVGADNVATDVTLVSEMLGAAVTWTSDHPEILADDGTLDRSSVTENTVVVMTATITKGDAVITKEIPVTVVPKLKNSNIQTFALNEVTLAEGLFEDLTQVNADVINSYSVDTILYAFRYNANVNYGESFELKGTPLGTWAAPGHVFAGHYEGHYMTAASMLYSQNQDPELKAKLMAVVDGLEEVQNVLIRDGYEQPVGYLSGFSEARFDSLEAGNQANVPWYMIHKIMQGLLDVYKYTGYEKALAVAEKLADWTEWRTGRLTFDQMQAALAVSEYGGMQDVLLDMYVVTGDEKYIEISERFVQRQLLMDPLYAGKDILTGYHGNTFLAKIVGNTKAYNVGGDDYYRVASENFWNFVIDGRTYVTGGNSHYEHYKDPHTISQYLSGNTCETCNIYNMLKVTKELFKWNGESSYIDYFERAFFNQILGSIDHEDAEKTYFQYMSPNTTKDFKSNTNGNYCCNGTGLENFVKLQEGIYYHTEDELYVNLFMASTLNWAEKGLVLEQTTSFPTENKTVLTVKEANEGEWTLKVRVPSWSEGGISVTVNGEAVDAAADAYGYAVIQRAWTAGDVVEVTMNLQFNMEPTTDNKNVVAFTYGPIVMAGIEKQASAGKFYVPYKSETSPEEQFVITDAAALTATNTMADGTTVTFMPYYLIQKEVHTVYWTLDELELPLFKENLALNKPTQVDEIYSNAYDGAKAVDGNTGTRWCVKGSSQNHWIIVDLEDNYYISEIMTSWEKSGDTRFRVYTSLDGNEWTIFADKSSDATSARDFSYTGNAYGRYVKVEYITSNACWCSIWELEVYGSKVKEAETLQIGGYTGSKIELPEVVKVTFEDGQSMNADVEWAEETKTVYEEAGRYTISGVISSLAGKIPVTASVEITVPPVDKSELEAAVAAEKEAALVEEDYTKETWNVYAEALANAESLLAEETTQEAVDAAVAALTDAKEQLKPQEDIKDELEMLAEAVQAAKDAEAAAKEAQAKAEAAREEANAILAEAKTAEEAAKAAQKEAETAKEEAKAAETAAKEAQANAEAAKEAAEAAKESAAADKTSAEEAVKVAKAVEAEAKAAAEAAKAAKAEAEAAETEAEAAKEAANAAKTEAETAQAGAKAAEEGAVLAQTKAEEAKVAADAAAKAAETSNKEVAAEAAKAAESAKEAAEEAAKAAEESAKAVTESGKAAESSAKAAEEAAKAAEEAAKAAKESKTAAEASKAAAGYAAQAADALAKAQSAQEGAENAQKKAETAKKAAEEAQKKAEEAQKKADDAVNSSEADKEAAEKAKAEAEEAKQAAKEAQTKAEDAEKAAKDAKAEAEALLASADLEVAKQAALMQVRAFIDTIDRSAMNEEQDAAYVEIINGVIDDICKAKSADELKELLANMKSDVAKLINPEKERFVDVAKGDWFYDVVNQVAEDGYMTGMDDTHFGPYESLSRAQFALILYRIEGEPEVKTEKTFKDISGDEWYGQAVLWAAEAGIVTGYLDGNFGPADNITREQMAVMMYRYAKYLEKDVTKTADILNFKDVDAVSEFAEEAFAWANGNGIITGKEEGTMLAPQQNTARAEAAAIIGRFMS